MDWKELGGKVAEYAPLLGRVVAGPPGEAIGGLVAAVADAFGLTPDVDLNVIEFHPEVLRVFVAEVLYRRLDLELLVYIHLIWKNVFHFVLRKQSSAVFFIPDPPTPFIRAGYSVTDR